MDFRIPPPPRREGKLFRADTDNWSANARLSHAYGEFPYREGFRRGANVLAQYVCDKSLDQDFLVYPIVYLYRHHVELALKGLLPLIADLAEEELDEKTKKHLSRHNLDELWADFKRFLEHEKVVGWCGVELEQDDLEGIDHYIHQLSTIDPNSQAFRYATTKEGAPSLPSDLPHINIAVFGEQMERLCNYLDGLEGYLDDIRDTRNEMQAEHRSAMYDDYGGGW